MARKTFRDIFENEEEWPSPSLSNTQKKSSVGLAKFDQKDGIGQTSSNQNVNYMGFTVMMKPKHFLALAAKRGQGEQTNKEYLKSAISSGKPIGSPFLQVDFSGKYPHPRIAGHEGRTRMEALNDLQPDHEVPVHIFPTGGDRSRDITNDHISSFRNKAIPQHTNEPIDGPHFGEVIKSEK